MKLGIALYIAVNIGITKIAVTITEIKLKIKKKIQPNEKGIERGKKTLRLVKVWNVIKSLAFSLRWHVRTEPFSRKKNGSMSLPKYVNAAWNKPTSKCLYVCELLFFFFVYSAHVHVEKRAADEQIVTLGYFVFQFNTACTMSVCVRVFFSAWLLVFRILVFGDILDCITTLLDGTGWFSMVLSNKHMWRLCNEKRMTTTTMCTFMSVQASWTGGQKRTAFRTLCIHTVYA